MGVVVRLNHANDNAVEIIIQDDLLELEEFHIRYEGSTVID